MALWVIRTLFLLIWTGLGSYLAWRLELGAWQTVGVVLLAIIIGVTVIAIDVLVPRKKIGILSAIFFGLLLGTIMGQLIWSAIRPALWYVEQTLELQARAQFETVVEPLVNLLLSSLLCYLAISFILQTQDDFRFVIPYVEFSRELRSSRPLVVDTSALLDGRIVRLVQAGLFDTTIIAPAFVLGELQRLAESPDRAERVRGRRALELVTELRNDPHVSIETPDVEPPELRHVLDPAQKLVRWTRIVHGKLVTVDANLAKLARAEGIDALNLNDVSDSLRPQVLPGDRVRVRLVRSGDQPGQGVGYLDDGTMVVIEDGRAHIGKEVEATVTSVINTHAGRMVFGRIEPTRATQRA